MHLRSMSLFVLLTLLVSTFAASLPPHTAARTALPVPETAHPAPAAVANELATDAVALQTTNTDTIEPTPSIALRPIGTYDGTGAEIVAHDPGTQRLFVTNSNDARVDVLDASDPTNPTLVSSININEIPNLPYGEGNVNSVAVKNGIGAIAIEAPDKIQPGSIYFFNADTLDGLALVEVSPLPDMVTFTPDGSKLLVAGEGEPGEGPPNQAPNPDGTIGIIDIPADFLTDPTTPTATLLDFFNFGTIRSRYPEVRDEPLRNLPNTQSLRSDFEPEYIAVSADGSTAYVTIQEENALAIVDTETMSITQVMSLGFKNHNLPDTGFDASDRDDKVDIRSWPVRGMYQPDAIASFEVGGETYLVTANEGDARAYTGIWVEEEEARVKDLILDPEVFPNAEELQADENLGRLEVTRFTGKYDDPATVRVIHAHPEKDPVDVYLLDTETMSVVVKFDNVSYFSSTDYASVEAKTYMQVITAADADDPTQDIIEQGPETFEGGNPYVVGIAPLPENPSDFWLIKQVDNPIAPLKGQARLRLLHLSAFAGPVDVLAVSDGMTMTLLDDIALHPSTLDNFLRFFHFPTPDAELDAGTYDLYVTPADDNDNPVVSLPDTTLEEGDLFDLFLYDQSIYADQPIGSAVQVFSDTTMTRLWSFGARSFSIWNGSTGELVWDSGDNLEQITAGTLPAYFNTDYDDDDDSFGFDNRSDAKGPEPEAVTTGVIGDNTYAFVGLERIGGIVVYDVTDPTAPTFVQYINTTNFAGSVVNGTAGDVGPEGIIFIPANESPNGQPLVVVAFEISNTTTVFQIDDPNAEATLTLLHNNDGESSLLGSGTTGGIAAFKSVMDREIANARSQGNAVATVYAGDAFLASATLECSFPMTGTDELVYDALAQRQMAYDAHVFGNHEFDYGPGFLQRFIRGFEINGILNQPFLSANLDFSNAEGYGDLIDQDNIITGISTDGRVIARSMVHTDQQTGKRFGIVSAIYPQLATISSPGDVVVLDDAVGLVQAEINRLQNDYGINKILFVSHLQSVVNDQELIAQTTGIDLAVAGGGDELLLNPNVPTDQQVLPGTDQEDIDEAGTYPIAVQDAGDNTVYIVTTPGNYRYLGRLDATFDANGVVTGIQQDSSYIRRVTTDPNLPDAVTPDAALVSSVVEPVEACIADLAATVVAATDVEIDVSRNSVRTREVNGGNLVADSFIALYDRLAADPNVNLEPRSATNVVVAVQNGGGIRQNDPTGDELEVGTISRLDTINVLPFDNRVSLVEDMTPADMKTIFEHSVSRLPESTPGEFLQVSGITVTYNLELPVNSRVRSIYLADGRALVENGEVVEGAPTVRIVTNSFTAGGGDGYETLESKDSTFLRSADDVAFTYEQALREYLQTFPEQNDVPTIPADDPRYQPDGEGRIVFDNRQLFVQQPINLDQDTVVTLTDDLLRGATVAVTLTAGTVISTATGILTDNVSLRMTAVPTTQVASLVTLTNALDLYVGIELRNTTTGEDITPVDFDPPLFITLSYTDDSFPADIDETTLNLFFYDTDGNAWSNADIMLVSRDTENNTLTVRVSHLTLFGFTGETAQDDTPTIYLPIVVKGE